MNNDAYEYKDSGLEVLIKLLSDNGDRVKVGVLGDKNSRTDTKTNAEIGARFEYGIGQVQRSFLRMPISEKLQEYLNEKGGFDGKALREVIKKKSLMPWLNKLGILGVQIVNDAFETSGFGTWKESNFKYKKNHQTLIESGQLRKSITFRVD